MKNIDVSAMTRTSTIEAVIGLHYFGRIQCDGIALSKGLDVIRNYPDDFKFDLVINDYTCGACLLGLLPKFKYPPLIGLSSFNNPAYTADIIGGDKLGLTVKPFYFLSYDANNMNIIDRICNGFLNFLDSLYAFAFI